MESSIIVVARCNDSDTRLWNSLIDNRAEPKKTVKYSIGTFIKINNASYILSCYHGIQNNYEVYLYQLVKLKGGKYGVNKIDAVVKCFSDELDLALLTFDLASLEVSGVSYVDINSFSDDLPPINGKLTLTYNQTKKISEDSLTKEEKIMELNMIDLIFEKYSSFNMPELPYLKCMIRDLSDDKLTVLKGLSGVLCYRNDKIVGMLMNYSRDDNCIRIIPSNVARMFINEFSVKDAYDGVPGIMLRYDISEVSYNGAKCAGVIVDSTYDIKYDELIKNGDIIVRLDGKEITKDGMIFDQKMRTYVPFETYISMNFKNNDYVMMNLMRKETRGDDHKDITVNVKTIPLCKIRTMQINHDNKYSTINGFVFTELTENIIEFYRNHNIQISGDILERYAIESFGPVDQPRPIVLINIINSEFSKQHLDQVRKIGLPLLKKKNTKNEYYLCILDTINKQKIARLSDIDGLLSDKNTFRFAIDKSIKLVVNFTKTNLSITYIGR